MLILALVLLFSSLLLLKFPLSLVPFSLAAPERSSPNDWVQEEQIKVYKDKVILEIPNALWAGFTDTNSMDPFLDERSNAIEIKPANPEAIKVGDVIAYNIGDDNLNGGLDSLYGTDDTGGTGGADTGSTLIHRVIEKGYDKQGIYYRVKGDNSTIADPFKVRFEQVEGVVVAVVY